MIEGGDIGFCLFCAPVVLSTEMSFEVVRSSNEFSAAGSAIREDHWAVILDSSMCSSIQMPSNIGTLSGSVITSFFGTLIHRPGSSGTCLVYGFLVQARFELTCYLTICVGELQVKPAQRQANWIVTWVSPWHDDRFLERYD